MVDKKTPSVHSSMPHTEQGTHQQIGMYPVPKQWKDPQSSITQQFNSNQFDTRQQHDMMNRQQLGQPPLMQNLMPPHLSQ